MKISGANGKSREQTVEMKAKIFLQRKNVLDLDDKISTIVDTTSELIGQGIFFQLVSRDQIDPKTGHGKLSAKAPLEGWLFNSIKDAPNLMADEGDNYNVTFEVDVSFGKPGAIHVENHHPSEFYLHNLSLHYDDTTTLIFPCNSWIYNHHKHYDGVPRVFFTNEVYLPKQTPPGILHLRNLELDELRGNGEGERQEHDRIYDYDVYNDLGDPDKGKDLYLRPVLGGSKEFPYPRRCRTGRAKTKSDPKSEIPLQVIEFNYIPRDERFPRIKNSDFLASTIKSFLQSVLPNLISTIGNNDFEGIEEIKDLYDKGLEIKINNLPSLTRAEKKAQFKNPLEIINELFEIDQTNPSLIKFPKPQILQENDRNWLDDDEFARQMLAGLNPMTIQRITEFPLVSQLDPIQYGDRKSSITKEHLEPNLEGLSVEEAIQQSKLYVVDYHDIFLPYLDKINALEGKGYASRSVFFLSKKGILKTIAIELSLPKAIKEKGLKVSRVFTPQSLATKHEHYWELAKTHVSINDAAVHQLVSHWLRTHCSIEPFIIATHRQLSVIHPMHILLVPHFKNTLNINALARKALINADTNSSFGAIIEKTFFAGKYSMELSSMAYKTWRFDEQGLPADLLKRGVAKKDPTMKHGLKLLIEDYPYAVDGLEIWDTIKEWVMDYINIFYKSEEDILNDTELQSWWREVREVGHADKKEGWINITKGLNELGEVMTTIIWLASAHHAAVNFGQYAYAGFMPNRPTNGRKLIPEDDDEEGKHLLLSNPRLFFLKAISSRAQAVSVMGVLEILSTHASDEEYLGQRNSDFLTSNSKVSYAFKKFKNKIEEIEKNITSRNEEPSLFHRRGLVNIPYTLLLPSSKEGMTGQGIPNSTSI